jgi:HEAT repeat protein
VYVQRLLAEILSKDWEVATRAAAQLRTVPGESVTQALLAALDADNTAITDAADGSLIFRQAPGTADSMWHALTTLDEDLTDHIWDVMHLCPTRP